MQQFNVQISEMKLGPFWTKTGTPLSATKRASKEKDKKKEELNRIRQTVNPVSLIQINWVYSIQPYYHIEDKLHWECVNNIDLTVLET